MNVYACKTCNLIQPGPTIFRLFFLCKLSNSLCFITVCIEPAACLKVCCQRGPVFLSSRVFSLLFFFFFFLSPCFTFFFPPPPLLHHRNLKYASKAARLCNRPANQPDSLLSSRPSFTDNGINTQWFIPRDRNMGAHTHTEVFPGVWFQILFLHGLFYTTVPKF